MGMFDYVRVNVDLEIPDELKDKNIDWKKTEFQTKDLENCLLEYIIQEDGTLVEQDVKYEYVQWTEEELKERRKNKQIFPFFKEQKEISRDLVTVNYHGTINFYCYEDFDENNSFSIDYKAYFIYGKLDKIELVEFNKYKSNKFNLKELEEKEKKEQAKLSYKIKKFIGWRHILRFIEKRIYSLEKILGSVRMILIRNS